MTYDPTVKRVPPAPICFSCGKNLPEEDYNEFHKRSRSALGEPGEHPQKVLDEMGYPTICCRRMFLGDHHEYRRKMALYDVATVDNAPHMGTV